MSGDPLAFVVDIIFNWVFSSFVHVQYARSITRQSPLSHVDFQCIAILLMLLLESYCTCHLFRCVFAKQTYHAIHLNKYRRPAASA